MRHEADAALRIAAVKLREWFEAMIDAGFTEGQAMHIIGVAVGQMGQAAGSKES